MSEIFEHAGNDQEAFWSGEFGDAYIARNDSEALLRSNVFLFSRALSRTNDVGSIIEFGANIGNNLHAISLAAPQIELHAVEINASACARLRLRKEISSVKQGSILNHKVVQTHSLSLSKGLLIHIHPENLNDAYQSLYNSTNRYVLLCEYYSPNPVSLNYRGYKERLFKRDFAGDMMAIYPDLRLIDYGFFYRNDPMFPQDDISWFLMEKRT